MNKLGFVISMIALILCSCNNNEEPNLNIELPIIQSFIPTTIEVDMHDISEEERQEITSLTTTSHIINDVSELPTDPIGQSEALRNINFEEHTLLIMYLLHYWAIDTYTNRYYRTSRENDYNWAVVIGTDSGLGNETEIIRLTRFAILVKKLPESVEVKTWYSISEI